MIIEVTDGTVIEITMAQVSDFLSLVIIACLHAYVCNEIYKLGRRDEKEVAK
jgi:hypothetical protein